MSYYTFADNAVPTSSQWNTNLRDQVITQCTSATRPGSPVEGQYIYQTDNDRLYMYTGAAWRLVGGNGPISFTPTWTNLTIGNGTQAWSYIYQNGGIYITGKTVFGTTTSIGGTVQMTVPNSHAAATYGAGSLHILDSGTRHYAGTVYVDSASGTINLVHTETGNVGLTNATNPITFTTSDTIGFGILVPLT